MSYLLPLWLSEDQVDEEDNLGVFWIISTFLFSLDSWYPSYTIVNWLSWIRDSIGSKYESNHMHMFSYKYYIPNNLLLWVEGGSIANFIEQLFIPSNIYILWCTDAAKWAPQLHPTREWHHCPCVGAVSNFFCLFSFPDTHRLRPKHTDSGRTGTKPANSSQNSKKKKKVQNAPFELNNKTLNYLSSQPNSFFNLQLSHSLCSPIPSQLSALHLPSLKDALSHSLRHILTLLFFAWLSVSSSPQVSSSPHLTDPLSTQVSN